MIAEMIVSFQDDLFWKNSLCVKELTLAMWNGIGQNSFNKKFLKWNRGRSWAFNFTFVFAFVQHFMQFYGIFHRTMEIPINTNRKQIRRYTMEQCEMCRQLFRNHNGFRFWNVIFDFDFHKIRMRWNIDITNPQMWYIHLVWQQIQYYLHACSQFTPKTNRMK